MRRRIEITVYRRSTVVLYDQPEGKTNAKTNAKTNQCQPLEGELLEHVVVRSTEPVGQAEAKLTTVDINRRSELALLIEALVKNEGNSNRAARQLGLSRSDFMSKLRGLGFSEKQ